MSEILFRYLGKIVDIYHDDDLKILINGSFWTYNPHAVTFCFNFSNQERDSHSFFFAENLIFLASH